MTSTVLTKPFETPFQTPPFHKINIEDYLPSFKILIQEADEEINDITSNSAPATFENTIEKLSYAGGKLDVVSHIFFNLNSAETTDEIQTIAQEISPLLTEFSSKISQNTTLFERVKDVYSTIETLNLNSEQKTLLIETYKGFVRNGSLLNEEDKKKLESLDIELSLKTLQFGQNVLSSTNNFILHTTSEEELKGIPESIIKTYQEEAKERNLDGYVITLHYPSYAPAITYAENRELRKKLTLANGSKSFDGSEWDNQQLIKDIVSLRKQKAQLLGYKSYSDFVLEERMAKNPISVNQFLIELLQKAKPYAQKEIEEIKEIASKDGIDDLQIWDHAYYAEKIKKQKFNLNDEEIKPFFKLENVENAVFKLAETLFGLTFVSRNDIPTYHPEVKTYEVLENGNHKAILYTDYHPRKGKRAGAWMTSFRNQFKKDNQNYRPHISIVCNFSKPTESTPSLLTFQEVTTLFHEFGHALHGILANTQYPNLSGTSVKWDFVELPSQFLENYCYEPEFLKTFAKHYITEEILSEDKIKNINSSKNFMEGYQTLRQIGFGLLDLAYHTTPNEVTDIKTFETEQTQVSQLYPKIESSSVSTSFSHIFQGGYASGYYSYKWAEVLDADAFQYFKENGLFNPNLSSKFKTLLSSGGTVDPMELYKNFRGDEPKIENLIKRAFS